MLVMTIAVGCCSGSCWDYRLPIRVTMTTYIWSPHLPPPPPPTPLPPPLPRRNAAPWSPSKKTIDLSAFPPYAQDICGKETGILPSIHLCVDDGIVCSRLRTYVFPVGRCDSKTHPRLMCVENAPGWYAYETHFGMFIRRKRVMNVKTHPGGVRLKTRIWCESKTHPVDANWV